MELLFLCFCVLNYSHKEKTGNRNPGSGGYDKGRYIMGTYIAYAYTQSDPQPSWMKAERYEYCEKYFKDSTISGGSALKKFFGKLLKK